MKFAASMPAAATLNRRKADGMMKQRFKKAGGSRSSRSAAALILALAISFSGAVAAQSAASESDSPLIPIQPLYVIQPSDMLEIFVWKEPELSRTVLVRPDGRISFPLIQDLNAAGMTAAELKEKVEELLKDYLEAPNVTVIVDAIRNYKFYVTGEVNNPSSFISEQPVTVLQALAMAGGLKDFADKGGIQVVRTYGREHVYLEFNYRDVIRGRRTQQNIILRPGDVVVVP
jgi:polysaccharide biosynthesis/export protein